MRLSEASALRRCLELLEPARRQAIALAYLEGLSHRNWPDVSACRSGRRSPWIRRSLHAEGLFGMTRDERDRLAAEHVLGLLEG